MAYVTVGEENGAPIELHYEDHGAGPPVVLIHGWPLSGRVGKAGARADRGRPPRHHLRPPRVRPVLAAVGGYDFDTFAADLDALLTALDLRDVTLVGFSMGGGEVARYVATYGTERVAAAVFAEARCRPTSHKSQREPGRLAGRRPPSRSTATACSTAARVLGTGFHRLLRRRRRTRPRERRGCAPTHVAIAAAASPKADARLHRRPSPYTDFRADMAKVTVPTLVLHSDADALVPFEASGKRTLELVPGSRLALIEDAPHGFNTTHAEQFNAALVTFLAQKERLAL